MIRHDGRAMRRRGTSNQRTHSRKGALWKGGAHLLSTAFVRRRPATPVRPAVTADDSAQAVRSRREDIAAIVMPTIRVAEGRGARLLVPLGLVSIVAAGGNVLPHSRPVRRDLTLRLLERHRPGTLWSADDTLRRRRVRRISHDRGIAEAIIGRLHATSSIRTLLTTPLMLLCSQFVTEESKRSPSDLMSGGVFYEGVYLQPSGVCTVIPSSVTAGPVGLGVHET